MKDKYVWGIQKDYILACAKERGIKLTKEQYKRIEDKISWAFPYWADGINQLIDDVIAEEILEEVI